MEATGNPETFIQPADARQASAHSVHIRSGILLWWGQFLTDSNLFSNLGSVLNDGKGQGYHHVNVTNNEMDFHYHSNLKTLRGLEGCLQRLLIIQTNYIFYVFVSSSWLPSSDGKWKFQSLFVSCMGGCHSQAVIMKYPPKNPKNFFSPSSQHSVERSESVSESSRRDQVIFVSGTRHTCKNRHDGWKEKQPSDQMCDRLLVVMHVFVRPQDLERQNETLQENLRKYHQEQRTLIDKVNLLQQQLSQVHKTTMQEHKSSVCPLTPLTPTPLPHPC